MRKHVYAERRSTDREESVEANISDESVAELATFLVDVSEEPLRKVIRAEALARLRIALGNLAEADREILVLRRRRIDECCDL